MIMDALRATLLATLFSHLSPVLADAACVPLDVLPLPSFPTLSNSFALLARSGSGASLPVVAPALPLNGTFFFPLLLGSAATNLSDASVPKFTLDGGAAYASGGLVLSTMSSPLLESVPLYVSADSAQMITNLAAVNATCSGQEAVLLRFQNVLEVPLAGGVVNGSFTPGSHLGSALLEPQADDSDIGTPVDLVIIPYDDGSDDDE